MTGFFRSILAMMALMLVFSCAETLEEHAVKEAAEFTQKNCPAPLSRDLTID
ncbi:MAG: hypothetical protein HUK08_06670, partial [Bacteroidaceae bacterium]|nr:hypothetical protein [Bacteroidaceae bacterium]